jgi:hypothetical protein
LLICFDMRIPTSSHATEKCLRLCFILYYSIP